MHGVAKLGERLRLLLSKTGLFAPLESVISFFRGAARGLCYVMALTAFWLVTPLRRLGYLVELLIDY